MTLIRLDKLLLDQGHARSRTRAQAMIKDGKVRVKGFQNVRPGSEVPANAEITLLEPDHPYVSRAALKLKALVEATGLKFKHRIVLDMGAAHGGFTQVALESGAQLVYAVDVGTGQLDAAFQNDPSVISLEKTDGRSLNADMLPHAPDVLLCDVSFISSTLIIPHLISMFPSIEDAAILVKPQFELQREDIGAGGIVRSKEARQRACARVKGCMEDLGFEVPTLMKCPLSGADGNQEYLLHARRPKPKS